ncbi:MAG: ParB N-terminal domain-containing protein [Paracoccus sp. (in: a-proteobacteria)]|nr:ParB N-terminal domain-containing protein [Paracoccus sp. (in: a-proteobacteria)]
MQAATLSPQPAPQILWVEVDNLVIDDRYQRPLNAGNRAAIRRIATTFRWSRFTPVIVAPIEGGRYALIDGQHRAHAAALCGITSIPAMVALVAPEEQAQAFIEINTRQIRVRTQSIYRAALTAGDDWAIRAQAAVSAAGCQLMTANFSTKHKKPGMVFAVDLIRRMIELKRDAAVTAGLAALMDYDPTSVPNFANTLLTPWLSAVAETKAGSDELVEVLKARRPWLVIEAADRMADEDKKPKAQMRRDFFVTSIRKFREDAA